MSHLPLDHRSLLRALRDAASLINSSGDLDTMLHHLVYAACHHGTWAMGAVMAIDRDNGYAHVLARHDPNLIPNRLENRWALATSPALVALTRNEPVVIADAFASEEFPGYRREAHQRGYRTVVVLPMGCSDDAGRPMVLTAQSRSVVAVTEEDLAFLGTIVHLGAIAVDKTHRLRAEHRAAERLQSVLAVTASLMEQVLADGDVASAAAMIGEVFPDPIAVVDLTANLVVAGRSPRPEVLDDSAWQSAARTTLSRALVKAARAAVDLPRGEPWDLLLEHGPGRFKVAARIEPLVIDREAVGALMVFPRSADVGDLDHLLLDSAKFALSVQLMRGFIRFRAEAQTLTDLVSEIVEQRWRDPADIAARALRLGFDLAMPARLVAIGLPGPRRPGVAAGIELLRSVARIAQDQHARAVTVALDDLVLCRLPAEGDGEEPARRLMRRIVEEAKLVLDDTPILVASKLCPGLADHPPAWAQCRRMIDLARRFKRRGVLTAQDFGPFPVLLSAADTEEVQGFVDGAIGAVARHDRKHGTAYVETLSRYLDQGCRTQACADAMGLHVTTLRYRLARIQELFGIQLDTPERRFSLELAIRLHAMVRDRAARD